MSGSREAGFWVGCYTTPAAHVPQACGQGILRGKFNPATARVSLSLVSELTRDPSYLARQGEWLAAVSERPDADGELHI
jgi:hypothetical protein